MTTRRPRTDRAESAVQVVILLAIGSMAGAASFTHVHNVAASHGQPGWLAWADAIVLELMSIATGLEIRRRHRAGQPAGFVLAVLVAAVVLSLSAQVVEAEPSIVGWLAAALPALGFLALVKIVLSRTPAGTTVAPSQDEPTPAVPVQDDRPAEQDGQDEPDLTDQLLTQARAIAADHLAQHGRPITRDALRASLRTGTDTATALHRQLRTSGTVPVPAGSLTRTNGTQLPTGGAR